MSLKFSQDTIRFDTVFTSIGSATRTLKINNPYDDWIEIQNLDFAGGESKFRMNVDGISGAPVQNVDIPPGDSIYVFLEVTIDPDQPPSVSPFILRDSLKVSTSGGHQFVQLEAWGQNANYIPEAYSGGSVSRLTCGMGRIDWDDPKPYVIWGVLLIDSCHLNIPLGAKIHVHGGVGSNSSGYYNDGLIFTQTSGRLTIRGSREEPVLIQGDRLESAYDDLPGQWSGIRFGPGSALHEIRYARIHNAVTGIALDSSARLDIEQSIISNCSRFSLFARHAELEATNVLFNDAGQHCVALNFGGNYRFEYCTLAGYGVVNEALRMDNFTCYDPLCETGADYPLNAEFVNCIITGSSVDEIGLSDGTSSTEDDFNYSFDHCLVRVRDLLNENQWPDFFDHCSSCLEYDESEPLFTTLSTMDYRLDSLSQVEKQARPIPGITIDLRGMPRDPDQPDMGAYEYQMD